MDGVICLQVSVKLEMGKENRSLKFDHQHANILHGSFILCFLRFHLNL